MSPLDIIIWLDDILIWFGSFRSPVQRRCLDPQRTYLSVNQKVSRSKCHLTAGFDYIIIQTSNDIINQSKPTHDGQGKRNVKRNKYDHRLLLPIWTVNGTCMCNNNLSMTIIKQYNIIFTYNLLCVVYCKTILRRRRLLFQTFVTLRAYFAHEQNKKYIFSTYTWIIRWWPQICKSILYNIHIPTVKNI